MRAITIGDEHPIRVLPQALPELSWVEIKDLVVDDRYQRPLGKSNWRKIRTIAGTFSWSRFTPPLCARLEDGRLAVVDGQHRVHAALLCGFSHVPVMVAEMDDREQARAFSWVNDQVTRISPFHIYKAALAAGDDWARECHEAVDAGGCSLMTFNASTNSKKPGEIYAIALIRDLVAKGHGLEVSIGLRALRSYDTTGRVPLYSAVILRPWLTALAQRAHFRDADLVQFLRRHDPYRVIDRLERLRRDGGRTGKTPAKLERDAFVTLLEGFCAKSSAQGLIAEQA